MGFTPPVLSMADRRRVKVVHLLLPLVTLLYYMKFISLIEEKTILSVLLTIIHVYMYVCLLTFHQISATCSLTIFRKTTECKNSDYWFPYIGNEFDLVVYTTLGLIVTALINTPLLLKNSMNSVMDPNNPIFSYVNLNKLSCIPITWHCKLRWSFCVSARINTFLCTSRYFLLSNCIRIMMLFHHCNTN